MDLSKQMTDKELRKLAEKARQTSVRLALWEPYQLYNVLADGIEELLDRVETAEQAIARVRELHRECDIYRETCAGCSEGENLVDWPCPTIRALEGDE